MMLDTKAYNSLIVILLTGTIILIIDMPYYAIAFLPLGIILCVTCLPLLWCYLYFDLNNFWWYQLVPFVLLWPVTYLNLPHIGYTDNEQQTHISFAVLALAHLGAATYWLLAVYKNNEQFPSVTEKLPGSAILVVPLIAWLGIGAFSTTA